MSTISTDTSLHFRQYYISTRRALSGGLWTYRWERGLESIVFLFFIKRYSTETEVFVEEVIFYGLSDRILAPLGDETQNKRVLFCMGGKRTLCVRSREAIWNIFEKPETSLLGNGKSFKKYLTKIHKMIHFVSKSHKCPVHIFHSTFNDQLLSRDDSTFSGGQLLHWKGQSLAPIQGLSSCKVYFRKKPATYF